MLQLTRSTTNFCHFIIKITFVSIKVQHMDTFDMIIQ